MNNILTFIPKHEKRSRQNMDDFISFSKNELTLFNDLDSFLWESYEWPTFRLCNFDVGQRKLFSYDESLSSEFVDFARAYFRYEQSHNPTSAKKEREALKCLEKALLEVNGSADLQGISFEVLDHAALILKSGRSEANAYRVANKLKDIANFLTHKKLIINDVSSWKNPLKRKADNNRTGLKGKSEIQSKMPLDDVLMALAEVFNNQPNDSLSIFVTSTWALLMSTGFRVSELLDLAVNAEVEQMDSEGVLRYGLRYYSGKGYGVDIKYIESNMVPVAKEAFSRLKELTEDARKLAIHLETSTEFFRHEDCPNVSEDKELIWNELDSALGVAINSSRIYFSNKPNGYNGPILEGRSLKEARKWLDKRQPKGFPIFSGEDKPPMRFSEALFAMKSNELHPTRATSPVILWRPDANTLTSALGPAAQSRKNHQSFFVKHGYLMPDGSQMKITSHQARHFLNTLAERGGMSQDEISKYFARSDSKHNRVYNHMSQEEYVQKSRVLMEDSDLLPANEDISVKLPITCQQINLLIDKAPVHITEYGICVHDYSQTPCDKFRDCLNCTEQVCIKGDDEKLKRVRKRLDFVKLQHEECLQSIESGIYGADRWFQYIEKSLKRLVELVEILESAELEDGALVKLINDEEHSHLIRAMDIALPDSKSNQILQQYQVLIAGEK